MARRPEPAPSVAEPAPFVPAPFVPPTSGGTYFHDEATGDLVRVGDREALLKALVAAPPDVAVDLARFADIASGPAPEPEPAPEPAPEPEPVPEPVPEPATEPAASEEPRP